MDRDRPAHDAGRARVHGAGGGAGDAGVEYDVLGIGYHDIGEDDRAAVVALHPRPGFKQRILGAFTDGVRHKPETTFGNVKADVLAHYVPGFERGDFVRTILDSPWPE